MDIAFKERFTGLREKYFGGAPLPIVFYYASYGNDSPRVKTPEAHRCIAARLARVATGKDLLFDIDPVGCFGGKHYPGFSEGWAPSSGYPVFSGRRNIRKACSACSMSRRAPSAPTHSPLPRPSEGSRSWRTTWMRASSPRVAGRW